VFNRCPKNSFNIFQNATILEECLLHVEKRKIEYKRII